MNNNKTLPADAKNDLLTTLKTRFEKNMSRHSDIRWEEVLAKLEANPLKLWALNAMEQSGGEPDVVGHDKGTGEYVFYDCSAETPSERRNVCYDREAQEGRKKFSPANNAMDMAETMSAELLDEEQYRYLQTLGKFDTKTSSWIRTPQPIRKLGGAIFGDRRYDHVFIYHNGADSYYAVRGFRCRLKV